MAARKDLSAARERPKPIELTRLRWLARLVERYGLNVDWSEGTRHDATAWEDDGASVVKGTRQNATRAAREVYEAVVRCLIEAGYRRESLGSGWWWHEDFGEEATLGPAFEQWLDSAGIDQREAVAGEPAEFWG